MDHAEGFGRRLLDLLDRYKVVLLVFFASRLALFVVGLMTQIYIEPTSNHGNQLQLTHLAALRMWGAWDSEAYVRLAVQGYDPHAGSEGQANWAFFPAFSLLSAGIARVSHLSVFPAMILVSNLSFLAALLITHRLTRETFGDRAADVAVALLCAVPGSYIFSSAYTESLFLLAVAACLMMIVERKWLLAGAAAALATLTRNLGLGLLLAMAVAAAPDLWRTLQQVRAGQATPPQLHGQALRLAGGLALPVAALAGFCLYLYHRTGDPFAFVTAQKGWGRQLHSPLGTLLAPFTGDVADSDLLSYAAAWLSVGLAIVLAALRRWALLALTAFLILVPLSAGILSYARFSLVMLPLFMTAGRLLAGRPAAAGAALITLATVNGFMMAAWTLDLWVTA